MMSSASNARRRRWRTHGSRSATACGHGRLPDEIDLPPASFDVVLLTDVLEHIEDDAASARTALNLLRRAASSWRRCRRTNGCIRRAMHTIIIFGDTANNDLPSLWQHATPTPLLLSHYNTLLFPPAAATRMASKCVLSRSTLGRSHHSAAAH